MPAQKNGRRAHSSLLCNFYNRLCSKQGASGAPQRTVGGNVDTLLFTEIDNLLLRESRMILDLVHCWDDGRVRQQLLKVEFAVVGDANRFYFAGPKKLFHILPCRDVGVAVVDITRAIWKLGE